MQPGEAQAERQAGRLEGRLCSCLTAIGISLRIFAGVASVCATAISLLLIQARKAVAVEGLPYAPSIAAL